LNASNHPCLLMPSIPYPRAFNHVGVGVSDLDQAIEWYQAVFGFVLLRPPFEVRALDGSYSGEQAANVLGESFGRMRQAHLTTANGVGFELFQLIDPPHERRATSLEFWKNGFFHVCITDPDVDGAVSRLVENGGKQLSKVWRIDPSRDTYKMCYCEDIFGNILEIYSHSYDHLYGRITQD
jgi:catechol 2,3-dioxygenase-like lactoylglutathione lyase family enzyme